MGPSTVILEQDHTRLVALLGQLATESNAKFVFLIDKAGQRIASAGDFGLVDPTALASLTAGNVAATEGVASLVGEKAFSTLFHEGEKESVHINGVGTVILLVQFDERSSVGLVRLRVRQYSPLIATIVEEIQLRSRSEAAAGGGVPATFSELTEDDIDALFG